ncbi:tetratricopeptide repeat protein [Kitasatospora sp. NPDC051853]|uniref:tetratricopeptide repeat protein n=1 Tax=Kitasatospora sp. NPDC051853 TaxID=3364058 RepID=UPI0037B8F7BC
MDAADLDRQARTLSGCIPPEFVVQILERGHEHEVALQAGQGEWFCARAWAQLLGERGRRDDALAVLDPYVATGWWPAARAQAELLESWGRASEAIALARPHAAAGGQALEFFARLLARHGGAAEAFELLRPGVEDWVLATALVDVAEVAGLDDDAARLLSEHIPDEHRCDSPWCCRGVLDADTALGLLAQARERQGRTNEAIALLRTRHITSVNSRDQLADLLARHSRLDELREYAATDVHGHARQRLAEALEARGDVEGAVALYRQADGAVAGGPNAAYELAQLLVRHGRGGEAVDVMRAQADAHPGEDWILHTLAGLCLDQGRPKDGLAHLDELKAARGGEEEWDLFWIRLPLITASSGPDVALQQALAHPEGGSAYAAEHIARVLHDAGRTEEAIGLLDRHLPANRGDMAGYFISLHMTDRAVELLQQHDPRPSGQWSGAWSS